MRERGVVGGCEITVGENHRVEIGAQLRVKRAHAVEVGEVGVEVGPGALAEQQLRVGGRGEPREAGGDALAGAEVFAVSGGFGRDRLVAGLLHGVIPFPGEAAGDGRCAAPVRVVDEKFLHRFGAGLVPRGVAFLALADGELKALPHGQRGGEAEIE